MYTTVLSTRTVLLKKLLLFFYFFRTFFYSRIIFKEVSPTQNQGENTDFFIFPAFYCMNINTGYFNSSNLGPHQVFFSGVLST